MRGKVVLITGGSRGIGRSTALEFGKLGASVVIVYNNHDKKAKEVVQEIEKVGGKAVAFKADVSQEFELENIVEFVVKNYGKIDILVNNAGIVFDREFEEITYEESLKIVKTNMLAPLFLSKLVAPIMVKNGYGKIINVSSTSGLYDFNPGTADYAMSKLALQSLTKDLSMKYAPIVNVNAVAPGWVNTDMNADLPAEFVKTETSKYHMKRWADPKEIADAIVFLASDKANYITGQVLILDGGHC
ncbi:MAG: glucose 1-dehydrogenase [Clostridia bacterium]|nr:glucose 1-dehydrogenase [Clostridia bacterium]